VAQLIVYGTVIINIFIPQCHIIIVGPPENKNKYLLTVPNNLILNIIEILFSGKLLVLKQLFSYSID
jgi:hypothetical protein